MGEELLLYFVSYTNVDDGQFIKSTAASSDSLSPSARSCFVVPKIELASRAPRENERLCRLLPERNLRRFGLRTSSTIARRPDAVFGSHAILTRIRSRPGSRCRNISAARLYLRFSGFGRITLGIVGRSAHS